MPQDKTGKLTAKDVRVAQALRWTPWFTFLFLTLSLPLPFFALYLSAAATDAAAVFLLLSLASLGVGILLGGLLAVLLLLYRRRWHAQLGDKLAVDGITAAEVPWFTAELTPTEREALAEMKKTNPLLADAYAETLASRLTATRIIIRTKAELLTVDRRINRALNLQGADTTSLLTDLTSDRDQLDKLNNETTARLAEAKALLQTIEASASRTIGQSETSLMLQRLSAAQDHMPLAIEMAKLEQQASAEAALDLEPVDRLEPPKDITR